MDNLITKIKKEWFLPSVTLLLAVLSYLLLSPSLGYFQDDWAHLYSWLIRGDEGVRLYYLYNGRPFEQWIYWGLGRLLGIDPFVWHFLSILLRWITALLFWAAFRMLWPARKREIGWVAILFVVYPLFNQQSIALTFTAHWICYLLFGLSILLMVAALKNKKRQLLFYFLSVLVNTPNLFSMEYFIGIEFIRPILIWYTLPSTDPIRRRVGKTLLRWAPFLLLAFAYIIWRTFLLDNLRTENSPVLLKELLREPLATSITLLTYILKDTFQVILGVWYSTFDADLFEFANSIKIAAILLIAGLITVSVLFIKKTSKKNNAEPASVKDHFDIQAVILGVTAVITGCAPGWLIMRTVSGSYGLWNDRFGFAAMIGACLFIVGMLNILIKSQYAREVLLAVMMSLAVGHNFIITDEYRVSSTTQNDFFHQLKWRAPYIQSRTPIYSDNEYFTKMGVYPTGFALNLAYPMVELMPRTDYWFYQLHKFSSEEMEGLLQGKTIDAVKWYIYFEADSLNGLVINWHPDQENCVWVLTENDRLNPLISENTKEALSLTNLERIVQDANENFLNPDLFGKEDRSTWCYYFEKADLARQFSNWDEVIQLYDEANNNGYEPVNGVELMPFIEGYARLGKPEESLRLSLAAMEKTDNLSPYLCDNWKRFSHDLSADESVQAVYREFAKEYSCASFLDE